jgi:hypothetical protein
MKVMLTILFLTLHLNLLAPEFRTLYLPVPERIWYIDNFDKMLYAFMKVESNFDCDTVNYCNAGGILQLRPEMIEECNRILKLLKQPPKYVLNDRLDSIKSVQIWYIVQRYWNPKYELKRACKIWNPLANEIYYLRIKSTINLNR